MFFSLGVPCSSCSLVCWWIWWHVGEQYWDAWHWRTNNSKCILMQRLVCMHLTIVILLFFIFRKKRENSWQWVVLYELEFAYSKLLIDQSLLGSLATKVIGLSLEYLLEMIWIYVALTVLSWSTHVWHSCWTYGYRDMQRT